MIKTIQAALLLCVLPAAALGQTDTGVMGQPVNASTAPKSPAGVPEIPAAPESTSPFAASANPILHVPVTALYPGTVPPGPDIPNPVANDPLAAGRGMQDFILFNCVGCHAPNGGGGMGPSLSNDWSIYGSQPAQIFLTILQGRPNGMPAWGSTLPESTIWDLVAYVQSLAEPRGKTLGKTISRTPQSPDYQQVPAEFLQTTHPWSFTEAFSNGQMPKGE